ncbi:MAG: branched-chain amino acid ABC transporter permease [Rhizobiales bacterium]|nr:branched-chain amino acid ABC transporter permease [Hyphomicrobiales bacterium]
MSAASSRPGTVRRFETPVILVAGLAFLVLLATWVPGIVSPRSIAQLMIWVVLVVGLYTFSGLSGIISFGQTTFSTIAAYCVAWLTLNPFVKASSMPGLPQFILSASLHPLASAAISIAVAAAIGLVVALAVMRLAGEAATIATFALLIVVNSIYGNWNSVTGGMSSIVGIPIVVGVWIAFGTAVLAIVVAYAFQTSRGGLMLQASRDDEVAARASGIEVKRWRIIAFVISAALMGLGGVVQAHFLGVISVESFYLGTTFMTLAMLVVGGRSSLTGAVVGAVILSLVTSVLRGLERGVELGSVNLQIPSGIQEVALGALMLVMLVRRRRGLCGLWEARFSRGDAD